jgi:ferric-dicitrate binding protein FerR (iron transport regulator)
MPFKVKANGGAEIEVLGTHFNVNAYDDEDAIRTTLLEGSVKVTPVSGSQTSPRRSASEGGVAARSSLLLPGQQAQMNNAGTPKIIDNVDIETVMAWKNGQFYFSNMDIATIMRQVERWYDVEVTYETNIKDPYTISLPRNVPVSQLLKFLELSGGVHFKIEGKKVTVIP